MELRIRNKSTYHKWPKGNDYRIGMTEPNCGSDLSLPLAEDKGDHYVVNGQKTFITNGHMCDMAIVAVKQIIIQIKEGVTLLIIEASMEGFSKDFLKTRYETQDTSQLFSIM
jgi:acyl-CoA dehydrogenase